MAASAISNASTIRLRPDLKPGVATSTIAIPAPATSFSRPVVTRPSPERTEVAAEPTVGPHRGEVVDEAEEPEAEHREQHLAPRQREPGVVTDAQRAEHGATGLDHQNGDHDVEATRGRDDAVAVVAPFQRR